MGSKRLESSSLSLRGEKKEKEDGSERHKEDKDDKEVSTPQGGQYPTTLHSPPPHLDEPPPGLGVILLLLMRFCLCFLARTKQRSFRTSFIPDRQDFGWARGRLEEEWASASAEARVA